MRYRVLGLVAAVLAAPLAGAAETPPGEVAFTDMEVVEPVADRPGDPEEGRSLFADRGLGNCLACHVDSDLGNEGFHGNVGPSLDGVGARWEPAQLRAIVANAKQVFGEQTVMPGFYTLEVGIDVAPEYQGMTILTAQQLEDVVAYLETLTDE